MDLYISSEKYLKQKERVVIYPISNKFITIKSNYSSNYKNTDSEEKTKKIKILRISI